MKIKNIKKIIFMLVAFLICPAFVFSACTNNIKPVDFQVRQTNLGILDYYNKIRNTTNNFIKYIPQIEELTSPQQDLYSDTISTIQDIENRIYLTLPALDFYLNNDAEVENESAYYAFEDLNIWDFELIENFTLGNVKTYSKRITSQNESLYLPTIEIIEDVNNCQDAIDDMIVDWGNALNLSIETATNYKIEVTTGFYYPSDFEVPERNDEIIISRNATMNQIIITYNMNVELEPRTFSKVVTFSNNEKIVKKYNGVYSPEATPIGQYKYKIENSAITGRYEIEFLPNVSYFKTKYYPVLNVYSDYYVFECYDLDDDMFISRLHSVSRTGVGENLVLAYDFYVATSGVDGNIKQYEVENLGYINDITKISNSTFAKLTDSEKGELDYKKVAFSIINGQTYCQTVGY